MPTEHDPYASDIAAPAPAVAAPYSFPAGSVKELISWIGTDKTRALLARKQDARRGVQNYVDSVLEP